MNREIKFRAWSKATEKMMDWDFIKSHGNLNKLLCLGHVEVMQFTGLTDKNGKEIYEGDNLKLIADNGQSYGNYEVKQDLSSEYGIDFYLKRHDLTFNWGRLSRIKELMWNCEVIGNIFENK